MGTRPVIRSDGTFLRDYLFVEDIVDGYLRLAAAIDNEASGRAYNFGGDAPLTVLEIYEAICRIAGKAVEPLVLDAAVAEIRDQHVDSQQTRAELGWLPRFSIEEGLRVTHGWYERFFESSKSSPT